MHPILKKLLSIDNAKKFAIIQFLILGLQYLFTPWLYSRGRWNQEYFNSVAIPDFNKGAIVDFKIVNATTAPGCPGGYEPVTTWFEGMEWGCICAGASKFTQVNIRKCTNAMLINSVCYDVPEIPHQEISNLNGNYLCLKRDANITYASLQKNKSPDCGSKQKCLIGDQGEWTCAEVCPITNIVYQPNGAVQLDRTPGPNPVIDIKLSEGPPCIFNSDQNTDKAHQYYVLCMPGWYSGCDTDIGGEIYSASFQPVSGFKNITEYELYNSNGLIKPLEKLINFNIQALKNYNMQLYVKRNLYTNEIPQIEEMAESGKVGDKWERYVTFFAQVAFYLQIARIAIDFLESQGSLEGKAYTYASLGSIALIYLTLALLVLSMTRVQAININTDAIKTDNVILQTTLKLLHDYTDKTSRYGFCLFFIIAYGLSEAISLFLQRRARKAREEEDEFEKTV